MVRSGPVRSGLITRPKSARTMTPRGGLAGALTEWALTGRPGGHWQGPGWLLASGTVTGTLLFCMQVAGNVATERAVHAGTLSLQPASEPVRAWVLAPEAAAATVGPNRRRH